MVSIRSLISYFSSTLSKYWRNVPSALFTIDITVILMFPSFLSSLARSKYSSLFSLSLIFTLYFAWKTKYTASSLFFFKLSLVFLPRLGKVFFSQNPKSFMRLILLRGFWFVCIPLLSLLLLLLLLLFSSWWLLWVLVLTLTNRLYHPLLIAGLLACILCARKGNARSPSCSANVGMSICWNSKENVAYELVLASPATSGMSCLNWMVCKSEGRWLYRCSFVGCCSQDQDSITFLGSSH